MTNGIRSCLCAAALLLVAVVYAHQVSMARLQLRETSSGVFLWQWSATDGRRTDGTIMVPQWPAACRTDANILRCGPEGLRGMLSMDGMGKDFSAATIRITWLDGTSHVYTLTAGQPTVQLHGSAEPGVAVATVLPAARGYRIANANRR